MNDSLLYCLLSFAFLVVVVLLLAVLLYRVSQALKTPPPLQEVLDLYRNAQLGEERLVIVFLSVIRYLRGTYVGAIIAFASAGFACLASICGMLNMREIYDILLDLATRVADLLGED